VHLILAFLACFAALSFSPIQVRAQDAGHVDHLRALLDEIGRRGQNGECRYLDRFADKNIRTVGSTAAAARLYALTALGPTVLSGTDQRCRYHNRKAALRLAIEMYEAGADEGTSQLKGALLQISLNAALGAKWRERLAAAGVVSAVQDLAALNLLCAWKGGQPSIGFWHWVNTDPNSGASGRSSPDPFYGVKVQATGPTCEHFAGPATLEGACRWNSIETAWTAASTRPTASPEMTGLRNELVGFPRGRMIGDATFNFSEETGTSLEDPRVTRFMQSQVRNLIASYCAEALPATTLETYRRQAAKGPSSSLGALLKGFR